VNSGGQLLVVGKLTTPVNLIKASKNGFVASDADELLTQKVKLRPISGHTYLLGYLTQTALQVPRWRIIQVYATQKTLKVFRADKTQDVISSNQDLEWQRTRLIRSESVLKSHLMPVCIRLEHVQKYSKRITESGKDSVSGFDGAIQHTGVQFLPVWIESLELGFGGHDRGI